jgi:hypothetical protein
LGIGATGESQGRYTLCRAEKALSMSGGEDNFRDVLRIQGVFVDRLEKTLNKKSHIEIFSPKRNQKSSFSIAQMQQIHTDSHHQNFL